MTKTYRELNQQQTDILLALYKFRFLTRDLISNYQDQTLRPYSHYRLHNLLEQKYIGRHYEGKDRLQGKQAVYFLANDGISFLKQRKELDLNNKAFNIMYKDKQAREPFIEHCLDVFKLFLKLQELYGNKLTFYSKSELMEYDFFPKVLPDGYFLLGNKTYFVEQIPDATTYAGLRGKIGQYVKHFNSGAWNKSGLNYPTILLISETAYVERQIQGLIKRQLRKYAIDNLAFMTTTVKALFGAERRKAAVWTTGSDELVPLA
jgi:Replication-relaxation